MARERKGQVERLANVQKRENKTKKGKNNSPYKKLPRSFSIESSTLVPQPRNARNDSVIG